MSYLDVLSPPDSVTVFCEDETLSLQSVPGRRVWRGSGVDMTIAETSARVQLVAPEKAIMRVRLRWVVPVCRRLRFLGDHWERGYGDFEWRGLVPQRAMPWYFLTYDGKCAHGYGVRTGAGSVCSWRVDPRGVSLWLDVRNGGSGVRLGQRPLEAAEIVVHKGGEGESPFDVARQLCRKMCGSPRLSGEPVYGGNNWYYAYGRSSHEQILKDTELITSLAPDSDRRPFMVIDDGWQVDHGGSFNGGPWDAGNASFPDMSRLANEMKQIGARPGLWFRPLWTHKQVPETWLFPSNRIQNPHLPQTLDPSVPEVLDLVAADMRRFAGWGFELIKHDFTTFDIAGRWGFEMPVDITPDGWHFNDRTRTTAEVIRELYRVIREAAGNTLVLGCNTVGHLAAGLVELQRTGDDTSGLEWERTRHRGINTLAFRMPQQGTFFEADADCVGLTGRVPWDMNRQWLDLVARSGTPLFVSASPDAVGPDQAAALRDAFAVAAKRRAPAEPLDWVETTCPSHWRIDSRDVSYDWVGTEGVAYSFQ